MKPRRPPAARLAAICSALAAPPPPSSGFGVRPPVASRPRPIGASSPTVRGPRRRPRPPFRSIDGGVVGSSTPTRRARSSPGGDVLVSDGGGGIGDDVRANGDSGDDAAGADPSPNGEGADDAPPPTSGGIDINGPNRGNDVPPAAKRAEADGTTIDDDDDDDVEEDIALDGQMIDDSSLLDGLWTGAIEAESRKSTSSRPPGVVDAIDPPRKNPRMQMFAYLSQPIVEVRVIGLVLFSCFLQAINTLHDLPAGVHDGIDAVDDVCVYIFAVEFFLRWWSAGRFQLRYLAKPLASIDAIVVILPLLLGGLLPIWEFFVMAGFVPYVVLPSWLLSSTASSTLLNLRLLRILKFQRVLTDQNTYQNFLMALGMRKRADVRPYQLQLARVVMSIFTLVSVSTGLIYTAEHEVNPQIPDYFTALYFGLTTLTTVGFGDITPVTFQGRLVVGGTILAGVAIIPAQAASLAEAYLEYQKERSTGRRVPTVGDKPRTPMGRGRCERCGRGPHRKDAEFCWSCGERLD